MVTGQVLSKDAVATGLAQFPQSLGLDLPDALACNTEDVTDLLQRLHPPVVEAVAQTQHVALARVERVEHILKVLLEQHLTSSVVRVFRVIVDKGFLHRAVVVLVDSLVERDGHQARLFYLLNLFYCHVKRLGHLLHSGVAAVLHHHLPFHFGHAADDLEEVYREADGARLVANGARHCLPDPPVRVRGKFVTALEVKLFGATDEPHAPLLDKVLKRHRLVGIALGDGHHQPQVCLDHLVFGALTLLQASLQLILGDVRCARPLE
mmetsp:Transcript_3220/g.7944  ORF Transcript_3220/g.7944 Transcript_3220/m.7944 type:complete len:265 (-) Transcript_3220:980-1774(-)